MNNRELVEALALHADMLNRDDERASIYVNQLRVDDNAAALFQLAGKLKTLLVPVDMPVAFREQLHQELLQADTQIAITTAARPGKKVLVGAATVGSLLSLAGLFLLLRRQRGVASFVELATG